MNDTLESMIERLENNVYELQDYKILFPNFKRTILYWVNRNAPHMKKDKPSEAIRLSISKLKFSIDFSNTSRLEKVIGKDFSEKIELWSKLDIVLKTEYQFNVKCESVIQAYTFNDRKGFSQWMPHIDDDDLKLRALFGESNKTIFNEWRNRQIDRIKKEHSNSLVVFSEAMQQELDELFNKVLNGSY